MKAYRFRIDGVFDQEVDFPDSPYLPEFHTFEAPPVQDGHYAVMRNGWVLVEGSAPPIETVSTEYVQQQNRAIRNQKLSDTDWTQLADVPLTADCKTAFAAYRQALRDLDMLDPVWPENPVEEWVA